MNRCPLKREARCSLEVCEDIEFWVHFCWFSVTDKPLTTKTYICFFLLGYRYCYCFRHHRWLVVFEWVCIRAVWCGNKSWSCRHWTNKWRSRESKRQKGMIGKISRWLYLCAHSTFCSDLVSWPFVPQMTHLIPPFYFLIFSHIWFSGSH